MRSCVKTLLHPMETNGTRMKLIAVVAVVAVVVEVGIFVVVR